MLYRINYEECLLGTVLLLALGSTFAWATGNILVPDDSNSRITVENAVVKGDETTLFYFTSPERGDPNAGMPCPLNYYSIKLKPGLPSVKADTVAKGICGGLFQKSRLLDNGDTLIIARDRLERWRIGKKLNSTTFSSIKGLEKLGVTTDRMGAQFFDIAPDGSVVLLVQSTSMLMAALKPDGSVRWKVKFAGGAAGTAVERVWAAPDGSALLYVNALSSGLAHMESQLHFISADGSRKQLGLHKVEAPMDFNAMQNMSPADMQKLLGQQRNSKPESVKNLLAAVGENGGFDVLFYRKSGDKEREGYFLYQIGADGSLRLEVSLGNQIKLHGLDRWFDFDVSDNQLILLSSVLATQPGVNARRKQWAQNAVSWIDLRTGTPVTRLIPLDTRYLEAAMNAGDEEMQYLGGLPGGKPALMTTLGKTPLVVSIGKVSKKTALRINEADEQLLVYTEAYDKGQQEIAKEVSRKQRRAARKASKQQMKNEMAAAVGMSPEAYAALSNREQKEAMIRHGDMNAIMASAMKQAQSFQQEMAASGNLTPKQKAQMQAAMAQSQQAMNNPAFAAPGSPKSITSPGSSMQAKAPVQNTAPTPLLKVDSLMRGHVQYKNPDGKLTTLLVFNRQSGEELLKKEYVDGVINEYVNLGRYKLSLGQLRLIIKNISGEILEDLEPTVAK